MLNEESRQTLYQDYIATALKVLVEAYVKCHGGEIQFPSFIEMTHEKEKPPTAQEIIDHVRQVFSQ